MKPLFCLSAASFNLSPKTTVQPLIGSLLNVFIYFCFMFQNHILQIGPLKMHEHICPIYVPDVASWESVGTAVRLKEMPRFMTCITVTNLGTFDMVRLLVGRQTQKKLQRHFLSAHLPGSRWQRYLALQVARDKHLVLTRGTKAQWDGTDRHGKIKRHELASALSPYLEKYSLPLLGMFVGAKSLRCDNMPGRRRTMQPSLGLSENGTPE